MPGKSRDDAPNAFPREEHLRRKADFLRVYREGRKASGRLFACYHVRRPGEGRKFGCSVSRKVGKAVVRNRVKRFLREVYRTHRAQIPGDVQLVVVARPPSAELSFHETRDELRRMWRRSSVLDG